MEVNEESFPNILKIKKEIYMIENPPPIPTVIILTCEHSDGSSLELERAYHDMASAIRDKEMLEKHSDKIFTIHEVSY